MNKKNRLENISSFRVQRRHPTNRDRSRSPVNRREAEPQGAGNEENASSLTQRLAARNRRRMIDLLGELDDDVRGIARRINVAVNQR